MCVCVCLSVFVSKGMWGRVCAAMMREYCYAHLRLTVQNKGMFTQDLLFHKRVNALYL